MKEKQNMFFRKNAKTVTSHYNFKVHSLIVEVLKESFCFFDIFEGKISCDTYMQLIENFIKTLKSIKGRVIKNEKALIIVPLCVSKVSRKFFILTSYNFAAIYP